VVYALAPGAAIDVAITRGHQPAERQPEAALSAEDSAAVFGRTGAITRIDVVVGQQCLVEPAVGIVR